MYPLPSFQISKYATAFNHSLIVTVAMSKLGYTVLIFVYSGVKVDGAYYCDLLTTIVAACHASGLSTIHISAGQCPAYSFLTLIFHRPV